jgi:hypothetical protein
MVRAVEALTLIVTTSQTQSNPDLSTISRVLDGLYGIEGLGSCRYGRVLFAVLVDSDG